MYAIRSYYELSIGVKTGIIKADSSSQFMSEYNKYIDYVKENLSISDTWLADEVVRGEVDITMVTISNQIKNNEISETDGLAKMKMSFDALHVITSYSIHYTKLYDFYYSSFYTNR